MHRALVVSPEMSGARELDTLTVQLLRLLLKVDATVDEEEVVGVASVSSLARYEAANASSFDGATYTNREGKFSMQSSKSEHGVRRMFHSIKSWLLSKKVLHTKGNEIMINKTGWKTSWA